MITIDQNLQLFCGDCLEIMKQVPDKSVDMILCDLPYGTTACAWDSVIPFDKLWEQYNRIIKDNGAIVLFGAEPFTSKLILSNLKNYRHKWVWNKNNSCGFALAKIRPFQICEDIIVFGKNKVNYYPIMEKKNYRLKGGATSSSKVYGKIIPTKKENDLFYPKNLLNFTKANSKKNCIHPTQKPVPLCEYLIKTYTNEGDVVLDNCMGSGTTGVACKNLNRKFIGIELDEEYFKTAENRIKRSKL